VDAADQIYAHADLLLLKAPTLILVPLTLSRSRSAKALFGYMRLKKFNSHHINIPSNV
jgi:hypothetical protein